MDENTFNMTMTRIVTALKARGHDPYAQLYGYIKENNPIYITSYDDARNLIQTLDKERVKLYVMQMERNQK